MQIGDLAEELGLEPSGLLELEGLIPSSIAAAAVSQYARETCRLEDDVLSNISTEAIESLITSGERLFKAAKQTLAKACSDALPLTKVGFARGVTRVLCDHIAGPEMPAELAADLSILQQRLRTLFNRLNAMRRQAERDLSKERVSSRIERAKKAFNQDHPSVATREDALILIEEIEASLDPEATESDHIQVLLLRIRREHGLDENLTEPLEHLDSFKQSLEQVKYAGRLATQDTQAGEVVAELKPDDTTTAAAGSTEATIEGAKATEA